MPKQSHLAEKSHNHNKENVISNPSKESSNGISGIYQELYPVSLYDQSIGVNEDRLPIIQRQKYAQNINRLQGNQILHTLIKPSIEKPAQNETSDFPPIQRVGEGEVREAEPEEISVEEMPPGVDVTRIREWEIQFNQIIQNRVAARVNSYALLVLGSFQHYASWVRTHTPEQVNYSMFNSIVDLAVAAACTALPPGMNAILKVAVQAGINAVRDAVKTAVRDSLASDERWTNTREQLEGQGANLVIGMIQSPWALNFPAWLRTNIPPEYSQVHQDYRTRMTAAEYDPSQITGEVDRWLNTLGVPSPEERTVPRTLLLTLISETRFAQIRERATSGIYTVLPGLTTGEERMFYEDPRRLRWALHGEALREAYRRIPSSRATR